MSSALVSIQGGVATCSFSGIKEPTSWDYIAVSEPNTDDDKYVCYEYNEEESTEGTVKVDIDGMLEEGAQYVIRYFQKDKGKVCDSAPFIWRDGKVVDSGDASAQVEFAPTAPASTAGQTPGKMSCTLVCITGGVATCKWSGIPEPTDGDFIAVSEPQADDRNYVYYEYNEKGTAEGTAKVDCSGGYGVPGTKYVIRYFQNSKKVCDSTPFIWSDDMGGKSSDAPAVAGAAPSAPVGPDGRLTPLAHSKIVPFLVISNVLFFGGFPILMYFSYGHAQCSTGPPNLAYGFLLFMVVFLTMGEICISRWLQQPGSYQAFQSGYQEIQQSEAWKFFEAACSHVFTKSIFEAKLYHYFFLGCFGRLELSDGNADALQPGQVRACEADGSIDEASWVSATHMGNITLSQAFLILAVFAFLVQGFFALYGLVRIRNLAVAEYEVDQAPNVAVLSEKIGILVEGYPIAAEVAEGVGAHVLCRLLEQASEEAAARIVKAGQEQWNKVGVASPGEDITTGTYEDAAANVWKMQEDAAQTYRDMVTQYREAGDEEQARYWEDYVKQLEAGLEGSKKDYQTGLKPIEDYYGTTKMSEVAAMQQTAYTKTQSNRVLWRSVFNKVLCEAAPSLFLLTVFLDETIDGLASIAKIKVIFSFSLSIFTCLSKAKKCFEMAKDPIKKQIDVRKSWKAVLLGLFILVITVASIIRFVGVIKSAAS